MSLPHLLNLKSKQRLYKFDIDFADIELGKKKSRKHDEGSYDASMHRGRQQRAISHHVVEEKVDNRCVLRRLAQYNSKSSRAINEESLAEDMLRDFALMTKLND